MPVPEAFRSLFSNRGSSLLVVKGHDLAVCLSDQFLDSAGSLSSGKTSLGGGDTALGTHDGSAGPVVQQEVDEGSCLCGTLAGLGDGQTHGNLGEAAVVIAELDLFANGEAVLVAVIQSGGILGSSGIPLEDACDLTGDPLVGLGG